MIRTDVPVSVQIPAGGRRRRFDSPHFCTYIEATASAAWSPGEGSTVPGSPPPLIHKTKEPKVSFVSEFKEFAIKGNVMDLAVGVIIGAAFGKIVDSVVKDLIMPIVGRIIGGLDFSNYFIKLSDPPADFKGPMTYEALSKAGVPLFAYGNFLTVLINFIILAFIIFVMVKQVNRIKKEEPAPAPAAPPPTPEDVVLLREIRDALKQR